VEATLAENVTVAVAAPAVLTVPVQTRLRRLKIESPVHEVAVKPFLPYKP
jgi:hypothetical protein